MLPNVATEVLHFLSRRDLDKARGVSKQLDALIDHYCKMYPFCPVHKVALYKRVHDLTLKLWITDDVVSRMCHELSCMNEALPFCGSILRHSYVANLQVVYTRTTRKKSAHSPSHAYANVFLQ